MQCAGALDRSLCWSWRVRVEIDESTGVSSSGKGSTQVKFKTKACDLRQWA